MVLGLDRADRERIRAAQARQEMRSPEQEASSPSGAIVDGVVLDAPGYVPFEPRTDQ